MLTIFSICYINNFINSSGAGAEREIIMAQSQLRATMYVCMYRLHLHTEGRRPEAV